MRRCTVGIILALALGCLVALHAAEAQQPGKVHRIGVLGDGSADTLRGLENLRRLRSAPNVARMRYSEIVYSPGARRRRLRLRAQEAQESEAVSV